MAALLTPGGTLFAPDAMLPAQFFGRLRTSNLPGEKRLMLAVMADAWDIVRQSAPLYCDATQWRARAMLDIEMRWVRSRERDYPFSFISLCEALRLSPAAVRARFEQVAAVPEVWDGIGAKRSMRVAGAARLNRMAAPSVRHRAVRVKGER